MPLYDALIVTGRLHTVQQCDGGSLCPAGETACGGWRWLSGCLDGLDKDIKGKQKAALWQGHRRGQTSLFSIQVGVSVQGYWSCRETGGGVGLLAVNTDLSYFHYVWLHLLSLAFLILVLFMKAMLYSFHSINFCKCKIRLFGKVKASESHFPLTKSKEGMTFTSFIFKVCTGDSQRSSSMVLNCYAF